MRGSIIIFVLGVFIVSSTLSHLLPTNQFVFATLAADTSPPLISSFDVNPKVLAPNDVNQGRPRVIAEAEVTDNVGVTVVAVYAYPEGTTDLVGQGLLQIPRVEGDTQDGVWRGIYDLWSHDAPDGRYEVYVEARDAAGNKDTEGPIIVTIDRIPQSEDTTVPVIAIPDDITEEATGPNGAEVSFEVTAEDEVDGPVDVSCDYNSGDTFPIGQTVVTCTAEDVAGNPSEESFTITVQDTTAPDVEITGAVDRSGREITDGSGMTPVPYIRITFGATDAVGIEEIECSLDGEAFTSCESPMVYDRLSRTTHEVIVRATDEAGNAGEDEFTWTVGAPPSNSGGRNR
ncbi:MAG: HYR domain-containing protein [Thermoproteota archaeon]|nr:HYR domain-containing protein [Thermoproteota archaeon]